MTTHEGATLPATAAVVCAFRKSQGLSRKAMAARLGYTYSYVYQVEAGLLPVTQEYADRLAWAFEEAGR